MTEREPYYAGLPAEERRDLPRRPLHVVLDNIRSAYNVGSMFRTSDASAVEHVYLCGMSAHPPHKKIEKTALGAQDYVPWSYSERTKDVLTGLRERSIPIVGIEVTDSAESLYSFAWPKPVAVVFGNEVTGISEKNLGRCDAVVKIPMHGYKNSLNVATAFGVVLFEIARRWSGAAP